MSTEKFTITIQGDSEGYVPFECPYCKSEFNCKPENIKVTKNLLKIYSVHTAVSQKKRINFCHQM